MAFVSVGESAVLTDLSQSTIYRDIKKGKLSRHSNGKIDIAELIRCYGESRVNNSQKSESMRVVATENDNEKWFKSQLETAYGEIKELRAEVKEGLERERQQSRKVMALLEHKVEGSEGFFSKWLK